MNITEQLTRALLSLMGGVYVENWDGSLMTSSGRVYLAEGNSFGEEASTFENKPTDEKFCTISLRTDSPNAPDGICFIISKKSGVYESRVGGSTYRNQRTDLCVQLLNWGVSLFLFVTS